MDFPFSFSQKMMRNKGAHSSTKQRLQGPRLRMNLPRAEWRTHLRAGVRKQLGHRPSHGPNFIAGWPGKREVLIGNEELGSNHLGGEQQGCGGIGGPAPRKTFLKETGDAFY